MFNTGGKAVASKNNLLTTVAWKINGETTYALEGSIFIAGAVVREAQKHGVSVPITATVHRLIKAKEASWALARERPEVVGA